MPKSLDNYLQDLQAQLAKYSWSILYSSFTPLHVHTPKQLRFHIKHKLFGLSINSQMMKSLLVNYRQVQQIHKNASSSPIQVRIKMLAKARKFGKQVSDLAHSQTCPILRQFIQKITPNPRPAPPWAEIHEQSLEMLNNIDPELQHELEGVGDFDQDSDFLRWVNSLERSPKQNLILIKYCACYLRFGRGYSISKICQILPLSRDQVRHAMKMWRNQTFSGPITERRGWHMKHRRSISPNQIEWLRNLLLGKRRPFSLKSVHSEFRARHPDSTASYKTIYRAVRNDLGYQFKSVSINLSQKNSCENKEYRQWFVHFFMHAIVRDKLVISIDESSLSFYQDRRRIWVQGDRLTQIDTSLRSGTKNYSLLLACSQFSVLGYFIVEGAICSVVFAEFINRLIDKIQRNGQDLSKAVLTLDNHIVHRCELLRALFWSRGIMCVFTPKYSPEVHFIENVFNTIKKQFRRFENGREK